MTTVSNEPSARATLLRAALTAALQPSADEYTVERTGAVPEALLDAALTLRATTCDEPIGRNGRLYLRRWHLTTRDKLNGQRVYLHEFCESDPDAPHDHPWRTCSYYLSGYALEWWWTHGERIASEPPTLTELPPGSIVRRPAVHAHRFTVPRETTHENRACCEISTPPGRVGTSWAPPGRDRGARSANDVHAMTTTTTTTTKWSVRQRVPAGNAIVWLRAPTAAAAAAAKCANERVGPLGGWRTDVDLEVFPRAEYPERAEPQDYTRSVIDRRLSDPSPTPHSGRASAHAAARSAWQ